jgi:hypothetical protein
MHLINRVLITSIFFLGSFGAIAGEDCSLVEKQLALLKPEDVKLLEIKGFAYSHDFPSSLPRVVISNKIISSCKSRYTAEKYFQNKIRGEIIYPVSAQEIADARKDIAKAVYYALIVQGVWTDGTGNEIPNTVSDELMPDWLEWQIKQIHNGYISTEFFSSKMFLKPDPSLQPHLNQLLKSTKQVPFVAFIYFLKKNLGENLDLQAVRRDLNNGEFEGGDIEKPQIIENAMKLLSKPGKVTKEEAWEFNAEIFGWV